MKKIIITVDGYSSCGKSTLAKMLSQKLDYIYIDSGAMYRAVTFYFLQNSIDIQNEKEIEKALANIDISFDQVEGKNTTFLNRKNIEEEIREMYVSDYVSNVAAVSSVRRFLVKQQQQLGLQKGIIMDGRDIGTVVFPDAALKIFLTADKTVRANRRMLELKAKRKNISLERVLQNLELRDHIDSTREDSPLHKAKDAHIIDNTNLNLEEQLNIALEMVKDLTSCSS